MFHNNKAIIHKLEKKPMQSAPLLQEKWALKIVARESHSLNDQHTQESQTTEQVCIYFSSLDKAVEFAKKHMSSYRVISTNKTKIIPKSYSYNFTRKRR